jgi:hypothetical protein
MYGIDIDSSTPKVAHIPDPTIDFYTAIFTSDNEPGFEFDGNLAGKANVAEPTYGQCEDALKTNVISSEYTTKVGQTICLQSGASQPNVAAIHVLSWDPVSMDMAVTVTVWAGEG